MRKRRFSICLTLMLLPIVTHDAVAQSLGWAKRAGGVGAQEEGRAVTEGIVTGVFSGAATFGAGEPNETTLTSSAGSQDIFVANYDSNGALLWARRAGGDDLDQAWGIASRGGDIYISGNLGRFTGTADFGNGVTLTVNGNGSWSFVIVVKYDRYGNAVWATNLGLGGTGFAIDQLYAGSGRYDIYVTGGAPDPVLGGRIITTWSLDSNGNLRWVRQAPGVYDGIGTGISGSDDDGVYVTGSFGSGAATFGTGEPNATTLTTAAGALFVAKYDFQGNLLWARQSAGLGQANAYGISTLKGNAYIVGNGTTTLGLGQPNETAVSGTFVAKYDSLGNLLWANSISGNASATEGRAIAAGYKGDAYVTGISTSGGVFVAKFNTNGAFLWARQNGGAPPLGHFGLGISARGGDDAYFHVTGFFSGTSTFGSGEPNETTLTSGGGSDIFLAQYMNDGPVEIRYDGGDGCQDFVTRRAGQGFAANCVGTTLSGTTIVEASATLALVKLHLQSTGQTTVPGKSAETRVRDTLTVTGGSGTGTLVWNWAMDGTLTAVDSLYSQLVMSNLGGAGFADFTACGPNVLAPICSSSQGGTVTVENEVRTTSIPFEFGVPLNVDWRLIAVISQSCTYFNSCGASPYSVVGNVDFFNTAQLQPLIVLDSGGNQVTGASAVSNSGFSYPVVGGPPILGAIGDKTGPEEALLVFDATATGAGSLTFSLDPGAPAGAAITSAGHFSWTPTEAQGPGSYPVTIRVTDDGSPAQSDSEQITITVTEVNAAPVAVDGTASTPTGTPVNGILVATDVDSATLVFSIVTNGAKGTAVVTNSATGAYAYTPNSGASGTDTFTFKANDLSLDSNTATITVTLPASAPVASNGTLTTNEDRSANGTLKATDPGGRRLTFSLVTNASKGTVTITNASTGRFTYVPNPNLNGADSFTFKANNGITDSNVATINVTITPVNDAPVAISSTVTTRVNTPVSGTLQATDVEGGPLTFALSKAPRRGSATVSPNGAFTYTPPTGFTGTTSFTFKVTDSGGASSLGTVNVTVTP